MASSDRDILSTRADYDAVVVGASLAGCATAILLARAGARVALVERRPELDAFKRVCGHFIQSSAVPALERLGLLGPIEAAGGVRSQIRLWTRWGWIDPPAQSPLPKAVNIRRERLDPLLRRHAAETPGVELILGRQVRELLYDGDAVRGLVASDRHGDRRYLRARLVVAADGRDSSVAGLARVRTRTSAHGRFSYGGYYEGPPPARSPDGSVWLLDPDWAAAFPTDDGLTLYACMPTKDKLPAFRRNLAESLEAFIAALPGCPPIRESRRVGAVIGKLEMPNRWRSPTAQGLGLVGDAALATDPLWGVGCGWAFQSAEWLADAVAPAIAGAEPLERGLRRYRKRHLRELGPHALLIHDYAGGRRFSRIERLLYSAAAEDPRLAEPIEAFASRTVGPHHLATPATLGPVIAAAARARGSRTCGRDGGRSGSAPRPEPSRRPRAQPG